MESRESNKALVPESSDAREWLEVNSYYFKSTSSGRKTKSGGAYDS